MALACQCCCAPKGDTIDQLKNKKELCTFEEEFKDLHMKELAMRLKVKETGSLLLDPNVTHPFVRVHIIDMNTGKYMAKSHPDKPGCYNREACSVMDPKGGFDKKDVDFLLPMSTRFFDMRIRGQTQCSWDESFIINEFAANIMQPNIILLFEILECNPMLIAQNSKMLNSEFLYPIAWGYLRPLGTAHIHMSRSRLQLFKYRMLKDPAGLIDLKTPQVLLEFQWSRRVKYPSFLEIELSFVGKSNFEV